MIQATIANCHRDHDKRREAFTAKDFMPAGMINEKPQCEPTEAEMIAELRALTAQFGGADMTGGTDAAR